MNFVIVMGGGGLCVDHVQAQLCADLASGCLTGCVLVVECPSISLSCHNVSCVTSAFVTLLLSVPRSCLQKTPGSTAGGDIYLADAFSGTIVTRFNSQDPGMCQKEFRGTGREPVVNFVLSCVCSAHSASATSTGRGRGYSWP